MLRLIQPSDIILPYGDTGSIAVKAPYHLEPDDIALFVVYCNLHPHPVYMQQAYCDDDMIYVGFNKTICCMLPPGNYHWDIKIYKNPVYYDNGAIADAEQIDSLYSTFKLPRFIFKEGVTR